MALSNPSTLSFSLPPSISPLYFPSVSTHPRTPPSPCHHHILMFKFRAGDTQLTCLSPQKQHTHRLTSQTPLCQAHCLTMHHPRTHCVSPFPMAKAPFQPSFFHFPNSPSTNTINAMLGPCPQSRPSIQRSLITLPCGIVASYLFFTLLFPFFTHSLFVAYLFFSFQPQHINTSLGLASSEQATTGPFPFSFPMCVSFSLLSLSDLPETMPNATNQQHRM